MNNRSELKDEIIPASSTRLIKDKFVSDLVSSTAAGVAIAYTFFPAESYKKYLQLPKDQRGTFRPYRGSLLFATNIVPTTAIHMTTHGYIQSLSQSDSSGFQKMVESFYCGVQGAAFATVMENIILKVNQKTDEKTNRPLDILKRMYTQGGIARLWKSYSMVAMRDGIFTAYMLWGGKQGYEFAQKNLPAPWSYLGNLGVGILGTVISHPFDMTGAHMQKTEDKITARQAAHEIYKNDGWKGFYKGVVPRFVMFYAFGNIIPFVKKHIDEYIDDPANKTSAITNTMTSYSKSFQSFFVKTQRDQPIKKEANSAPKPNEDYVDLRTFKK